MLDSPWTNLYKWEMSSHEDIRSDLEIMKIKQRTPHTGSPNYIHQQGYLRGHLPYRIPPNYTHQQYCLISYLSYRIPQLYSPPRWPQRSFHIPDSQLHSSPRLPLRSPFIQDPPTTVTIKDYLRGHLSYWSPQTTVTTQVTPEVTSHTRSSTTSTSNITSEVISHLDPQL